MKCIVSCGPRAIAFAAVWLALVRTGSAADRSPPPARVDAELLLALDLLGDERFADRGRGASSEHAPQPSDDLDLPDWDDDERREEPRR